MKCEASTSSAGADSLAKRCAAPIRTVPRLGPPGPVVHRVTCGRATGVPLLPEELRLGAETIGLTCSIEAVKPARTARVAKTARRLSVRSEYLNGYGARRAQLTFRGTHVRVSNTWGEPVSDNATGKVIVKPADLRASAGIAKSLGEEFGTPVQNALNTSSTVAGQLTGWSIAGGLGQLGTGWSQPLGVLQQRLASTATNLNANAAAHEHNDSAVAGAWATPQKAPK